MTLFAQRIYEISNILTKKKKCRPMQNQTQNYLFFIYFFIN